MYKWIVVGLNPTKGSQLSTVLGKLRPVALLVLLLCCLAFLCKNQVIVYVQ